MFWWKLGRALLSFVCSLWISSFILGVGREFSHYIFSVVSTRSEFINADLILTFILWWPVHKLTYKHVLVNDGTF